MSSRALSLATVMLLIGCLSAGSAHAQNLEAGKSPSQIFANACTACHKGPRGLLKTVPASSLPGFLRQHYTTSSDMASVLASYLVSNGANDPRYQGKEGAKGGKDGGQEAKQTDGVERPGRRQRPTEAPQEAAKPDVDGLTPTEGRPSRKGRRLARPSEEPEGAKSSDGQAPDVAGEGKPSRRRLGRHHKPVEEKSDDAAKGEAPKGETSKGEAEKPAGSSDTSDSAKVDTSKEGSGSVSAPLRPDPVPAVTPASPAAGSAPAASAPAAPQPAEAAAPPTQPASR
jgi:hypothetical protein